jgi:hypothetical protein
MVAAQKKPLSEERKVKLRANIAKARTVHESNALKQKALREKYGVSSSDDDEETEEEEPSSSEDESVIFKAVRKKTSKTKQADDIPVSELQMMRLELAEIKKTLTAKRPRAPRKKNNIIKEVEVEKQEKKEEPEKQVLRSVEAKLLPIIEITPAERILKKSPSSSSVNSLGQKETASEKIARLTARFIKK